MQKIQADIASESNAPSPLLRVSGLSKRFGATQALKNVSIQFQAGEIHCVLGENGAGKSTIGKIISGLYSADEGVIWYADEQVSFSSSREARHAGVVMVYQELSLAPSLSVRANLWLGSENGKTLLSLTRRQVETKRVREVLSQLGLDELDIERPVSAYPVAIQQLIEIGKSLMSHPRVIIFDEPTAMLGAVEKENFFNVLRRLRTAGIASVLVTHHIDDVVAVSDRVTIMRNGQVVDAFPMNSDITGDLIVTRLTGKKPENLFIHGRGCNTYAPLIDIENVPKASGGRGVFTIGRGEIVGIYGVVGCGGDVLLQQLVGFIPGKAHDGISFRMEGQRWKPSGVSEALRHGVAWLPAGRASNCVYASLTISENLMITQLKQYTRCGMLNTRQTEMKSDELLKQSGVKYGSKQDLLTSLSGGNQQKVLLTRAMACAQKILVLEEPTAGVDIDAKHEIHQRIRALASSGVSVLMLSSDLAETMMLSDTVWTMFHGSIVKTYSAPDENDKASIIADVVGQKETEVTTRFHSENEQEFVS
ncbi:MULTISPECIES: sugar ABC transporter ATP-binding protein [Pantoea]|uniref:sugar ABC transporter ATP-binding protein n=1 Tax=Pantoea TaxID=53335 RepID=UPI00073F4ED6|nr:sugar ABC transporter ATP-binding protein [Pantoea dispersa]UYV56954.1 sugar ABC transporter ATP-binding protein [Pantoea dispersa]